MGYIQDEEFMKGQQLDPYGANLASASLPGGGKVPDPWMTHYVDNISSSHMPAHNSPHAIVPDILAHEHEYPAGRQRINDSGASLSARAVGIGQPSAITPKYDVVIIYRSNSNLNLNLV
eukprot:scaffold4607_cov39-Cyclotella_meneghiniana.AAC.7